MKTKECPSCAMEVDQKHEECPYCQYEFPDDPGSGSYLFVFVLIGLLLLWILF